MASDLERLSWVRPVVRVAARKMRAGTALDLGAGVGRHALFLAKKGMRVTAVESSPTSVAAMRELARLQALPVRTVCGDATRYVPKGRFDAVLACMLLHFLDDRRRESLIEMMKGATRKGGIVVTTDYSVRNPAGTRPNPVSPEDLERWFPADAWEVLYSDHRQTESMPDLQNPGREVRFWVIDRIVRRVG